MKAFKFAEAFEKCIVDDAISAAPHDLDSWRTNLELYVNNLLAIRKAEDLKLVCRMIFDFNIS